jgi:uncharacterized membrane protein YhaH (DUF805 family)
MPSHSRRLPVTHLLIHPRGRIGRIAFAHATLLIGAVFYLLYTLLDRCLGHSSTLLLYPILAFTSINVAGKRLHDLGRSRWWLAIVAVPVIGPLYLAYVLLLRRGQATANSYGPGRETPIDYHQNPAGIPASDGSGFIIDDVTQLNPIVAGQIVRPSTIEDLQAALRSNPTSTISAADASAWAGRRPAQAACTSTCVGSIACSISAKTTRPSACKPASAGATSSTTLIAMISA